MRMPTVSSFKPFLLAGCMIATALGSQLASAQAREGVFSSFGGDWRGVGTVVDSNGKTEPLRCRESNVVSDDNISLTQSLVCASDSYRVELHATLFTDGHTIRGTWEDTTRNTGGNIYGEIANNAIVATISAPGVNARLSARTTADRQEVTLEPQGTQINKVVVTMKR
jgi:hypothetical protein